MQQTHRFVLALYRSRDGALLGTVPLPAVDWEPAYEWTRWTAIRRGQLEPGANCSARVEPVWDPEARAPHALGFAVSLSPDGGEIEPELARCTFNNTYFAIEAERGIQEYVRLGELQDGDRYRYRTLARPLGPAEEQAPRRIATATVTTALPIRDGDLAAYIAQSRLSGEPNTADAPIFVPATIVSQAEELTRAAGDVETGGILVGHLVRDRARSEVFTEVTGLVPARNATADATSLHFTPEVWSDVHAAIALRGHEEIWVGWFHSHPVRVWCRKCAPERQATCSMRQNFFSEHDRSLHRSVFPAAFNVAWVVNDSAQGLSHSCFGWRLGALVQRAFHILQGAPLGVAPVR